MKKRESTYFFLLKKRCVTQRNKGMILKKKTGPISLLDSYTELLYDGRAKGSTGLTSGCPLANLHPPAQTLALCLTPQASPWCSATVEYSSRHTGHTIPSHLTSHSLTPQNPREKNFVNCFCCTHSELSSIACSSPHACSLSSCCWPLHSQQWQWVLCSKVIGVSCSSVLWFPGVNSRQLVLS